MRKRAEGRVRGGARIRGRTYWPDEDDGIAGAILGLQGKRMRNGEGEDGGTIEDPGCREGGRGWIEGNWRKYTYARA